MTERGIKSAGVLSAETRYGRCADTSAGETRCLGDDIDRTPEDPLQFVGEME